jgi:hypothetical protein
MIFYFWVLCSSFRFIASEFYVSSSYVYFARHQNVHIGTVMRHSEDGSMRYVGSLRGHQGVLEKY